MIAPNTGGPAFPVSETVGSHGDYREVITGGMTLRDYFAAKAMQGMFANGELTERSDWSPQTGSIAAYAIADAMLAARGES